MKRVSDYTTVFIGIFVIAAFAGMGWMLLFLHPPVGDAGQTLRVQFNDIDKISEGTRVTYAGRPVGRVVDIREVQDARLRTDGPGGRVYIYELTLEVDSSVQVFTTDEISSRTSGLLGERSVDITPVRIRQRSKKVSDETLYAQSIGSVEDAVQVLQRISGKIELALDEFTDLIQSTSPEIKTAVTRFNSVLEETDLVLARANETDLVGSLQGASAHLGSVMLRLDQGIAEMEEQEIWTHISEVAENLSEITGAINQPGSLENIVIGLEEISSSIADSWPKIDQTLDDFSVTAENAVDISEKAKNFANTLDEVATKVNQGEGTIGRFLNTDDFYVRAQSVLSKVETLMNDVNHYGLLFHLDKSWQRSRIKRSRALAQLSTARQFRNYFDEEVDDINTSLSRVSDLLDRAEKEHPGEKLIENRYFVDVFGDLLRKVVELEDLLKLYNEKLVAEGEERS